MVAPATRQEVPLYLSICDWNLFFIKDAYSKKASSPTKQGEIMAMGVPIICNDIGDTGQIITDSAAGIVVNELTEKEFERVALLAASHGKFSKEQIRNGAVRFFDLKNGRDRYNEVYEKILQH